MKNLIKNKKQQRIQQAKAANTRERNIAKQYFNSGPSIGNLARAAYHYWNSVPELGGEDESGNIVIGGEAPTPGMRNPKSIVKGVKPAVKIVKENASKITPKQWTDAQDATIARGDIAEAQRLRDLHFKVSAPNTQIKDIQYHGAKGNATFNVFDPKLIGQTDQGWAGRGYYFTPSKDYAKMYGSEPRAFYINAQKVHDGTASTYFGREDSPAAHAFKIVRKKHGNNGQQILDDLASSDAIRTSFSQTRPYNGTFEEVVTRNNNQMKLADAVTYDDKGIRIPLGERDNFNINDIRYGLLPIVGGIGLGAYSVNKKKQGGQIVKNFKRKFQFGGKYTYDWKNSSIKTSYGYPVYWSNNVPEEYKWATDFLKNNPNITGMAVGGGAQGDWDTGPRVIIRNLNSNIITDPKDPRWNGLDKIEAVRHYMVETNYKPYFKISPEQEYFRKTKFPKTDPYNTNDDAWRESIISRIIAGDMEGTPEQMKIVDKFEKDFYKQKGNGKYW